MREFATDHPDLIGTAIALVLIVVVAWWIGDVDEPPMPNKKERDDDQDSES